GIGRCPSGQQEILPPPHRRGAAMILTLAKSTPIESELARRGHRLKRMGRRSTSKARRAKPKFLDSLNRDGCGWGSKAFSSHRRDVREPTLHHPPSPR